MKVLLVSTNPRITSEVETALVGKGDVELLEVRTPERALQQLDEVGGFGLVLADADTAPTGGFALSREVKAREQMGAEMPPVILLIARDDDRFLAKWSQADAYLRKPPDPFDLAEVVDAVVAGTPVPALPHVGSARGDLPYDLQGIDVIGAQGGGSMLGGAG